MVPLSPQSGPVVVGGPCWSAAQAESKLCHSHHFSKALARWLGSTELDNNTGWFSIRINTDSVNGILSSGSVRGP